MNRVRKIVVAAGIVALVAGGGAALFAQGASGRGGARPGGPGARGFDAGFALGQLDLSDAQKTQVRDVVQRHRQQLQPTMQRLEEAMQAQRGAVNQVPVNEAAVRQAAASVASVQADLAVEQARLHADVWNILTPDQQEKAKQLEQQAQNRAQNRAQQRRQQRDQRQPKQPV
jgi:protein CpxP